MLENGSLLEHYGKLKRLEKLLELNLSVLEELEEILLENLEELEEYLLLLDEEERVFAEKLRASIRTILKHLDGLKRKTESDWEKVEFTILKLCVRREPVNIGELSENYLYEFYHKLEVLRDYIDLHRELFAEELQKYNLFDKFPADVYIGFLEKLTEFNSQFRR